MSITGVIIGIIVMALVVLFAVFSTKEAIESKKELKEFEKKVEAAEKKSEVLVEHNQKSNEIKEEKIKTQEEINNAKSKEELVNLANSIADDNNGKLRKSKETGKQTGTSAKTGKTRTSKA